MYLDAVFPRSLYLGADAPGDYIPLTRLPLIVLVGLTGAGKSTAARRLVEDCEAVLLPDRRLLTDKAIISRYTQGAVTDRQRRYALTARFREENPGGMAAVLQQIALHPGLAGKPVLFDNLRGVNEVAFAARHLPKAVFILVSAPNAVRLRRLLTRHDSFDRTEDPGKDICRRLERFVGVPAAHALMDDVRRGTIGPGQLSEKLAILETEADSYSAEETGKFLLEHMPDRTIVYPADSLSPDAVPDLIRPLMTRFDQETEKGGGG